MPKQLQRTRVSGTTARALLVKKPRGAIEPRNAAVFQMRGSAPRGCMARKGLGKGGWIACVREPYTRHKFYRVVLAINVFDQFMAGDSVSALVGRHGISAEAVEGVIRWAMNGGMR